MSRTTGRNPLLVILAALLFEFTPKPVDQSATAPRTGTLSLPIVSTKTAMAPSSHAAQKNAYGENVSNIFPRPAGLESQIDFWRKVYGAWGRCQVVFHDNRHLDLVYEVLTLPGDNAENDTTAQQEWIKQRKAFWEDRLRQLETKLTDKIALNTEDQQLVAQIVHRDAAGSALKGIGDRVRVQRGLKERFKRGLEISGRYERAMRARFAEAGLPADLALLPHVESSFQSNARSSVGALGIWQFTRSTAMTFMHVDGARDERLDPLASARGAARYLDHAYKKLGAWPLALTSYNHGIAGMLRAKNRYGDDFDRIVREYEHPQFGFASRNFYSEFLAAVDVASEPLKYFPEGVNYEPPVSLDWVILTEPMRVSALAQTYHIDKWQLGTLNPAWSDHAKMDQIPLPAGSEIWLPAGTLQSPVKK